MNLFVANLLLALVWGAMTGSFAAANLILGFVLGFVVLLASSRVIAPSPYFSRLGRAARFVAFYVAELVRANLRVAHDVVTPQFRSRPGIVAIPLDAKTDMEITLLANLVTMTPGSLSLDLSDDRRVLYVHSMFMDDPDEFRRTTKEGLERRVLGMLR